MWPITSRLLGLDYSTIIERPGGYKIKVDLKDQLNRILLFYGRNVKYLWEPQTTKVAQMLIANATHSVVAGSHIGYINLELLSSLAPDARIYTFEPAGYLYERSKENIALNQAGDRIKLFHAALSDRVGETAIYVEDLRTSIVPYSAAHTVNDRVERVPTLTLGTLKSQENIPRLDFLFLDVEGFEYQILTGAKDVLMTDKPTIIFEVSEKILRATKITADMLYTWLRERGYSLFVIDDNYELDNVTDWDDRPVKIAPVEEWKRETAYINVVAVQNIGVLEKFKNNALSS